MALQQRSSTDRLLRGMSYRGKQIAGTFKGSGTNRRIQFTDGTSAKVHRSDLHELAKLRGTEIYRGKYKAAGRKVRRIMLGKSMRRQKAVHGSFLKRLKTEAEAAPPAERRRLLKKLSTIARGKFGSPLIGKRPASSLWSNAQTHTVGRAHGG